MKSSKKMTPTQFPNEIKFLSKVYKIDYCARISQIDFRGEDICFGQVNFRDNSIRIFKSEETPDIEVWAVLFHEIFHIIQRGFSISFTNDNEEKIVDNLATAFLDILVSNNLQVK